MLTELVNKVQQRDLSARDLVEAAIDRIERIDPRLNAVVARRFEEALREADEQDTNLGRGQTGGRLCGVPVLVKDLEDVQGMRTTCGSLVRADSPPAETDGIVPRRLRGAGAIVVGKSNLPEFAAEAYASNRLFGTTRNPWSLQHTPGGSSGGSAAAMAAGLVPVATATDGGGSIRIPAAWCGLVGLKPTNGLVARDPIPAWMDLSTDGPLALTVDDLVLLASIEIGPVEGDPSALPEWRVRETPPAGAILAAERWVDWGPLPPDVHTAFQRALKSIEGDMDMPVDLLECRDLFTAGNPDLDWYIISNCEQAAALGPELIETRGGDLDPGFLQIMREGLATPISDYLAVRRRRFSYVRDLDRLLGEQSLLVMPTCASSGYTAEGLREGATEPGSVAEDFNTVPCNLTGHPAISLPAGVTPNGVPFGIQVTAPRFRDDLLLGFARRWEAANPWPMVAPGYEEFGV